MFEDIRHIGQDITQNIIFVNGGTFCPSLSFWTILSKLPASMIQNIIFGNGGTFRPGLPFSDNFDKGTPSRFFSKMFIFVLVPRNLIMSGVRPDSILSPFWKSSHIVMVNESILSSMANAQASRCQDRWFVSRVAQFQHAISHRIIWHRS